MSQPSGSVQSQSRVYPTAEKIGLKTFYQCGGDRCQYVRRTVLKNLHAQRDQFTEVGPIYSQREDWTGIPTSPSLARQSRLEQNSGFIRHIRNY